LIEDKIPIAQMNRMRRSTVWLPRLHVHLRWKIDMKKTRRICRELGLQLRNKHQKRRVKAKLRDDRKEAVGLNDVWAMDFVHD
jgi:putative transposase